MRRCIRSIRRGWPQLPPRVRERYERFSVCDGCERVFWEGSHWRRMRSVLYGLLESSKPL